MTIKIAWDNEDKTILRYEFSQQWTWDEFFMVRQQAVLEIDSVSHKVAVIVYTPPDMAVPPNLLTNIRQVLRNTHPNTCLIIFVTTTSLLRTITISLRSITYLTPVRLELAATLDEARLIAQKHLVSIPATS